MAANLKLEWNPADLAFWQGDAITKAIVRTMRNAGDRAARAMQTQAVKYIQSRKLLKSTFVRSLMYMKRPGQSSTLGELEWKIGVSGRAIPLTKYQTRFSKTRGWTVRVNPGKATRFPSAFGLLVGTGHGGLFMRKGKSRYPIKELFSSRLTDVLQDEGAIDALFAPARATLNAAFATAIGEAK